MKTKFLISAFLLFNMLFSQEVTEQIFTNDVNKIVNDAATGFQTSKGNYKDKQWITTYNYSNLSIFNSNKDAFIGYSEATYLKYSKKNLPEEYFFYQGFDSKNANGIFVFENAERIFDELANVSKLKKKVEKQEKKDKDKLKSILYLKNNRKVFQLYYNLENKSVTVYIHSDLRPNDLPNYLGCLVLYNIQSGQFVSANTYYVYGKSLASSDILYAKILSDKDETFKRLFSKYEWMPYASEQQVDQKMTGLGIKEYSQKINSDGYGIR